MGNREVIERYNAAVMGTYGRKSIALENGSGCGVCDADEKRYIDLGSGIGTNSLGFADADWADAVAQQAHSIQHTSNYYYNSVAGQLANELTAASAMDALFFANSGAEANECAIKLARKYSFDRYGKGRHTIITLVNSFHGRTIATLSATGQDVFHNYFFPFVEGFRYVEANNIDALHQAVDDTVCAIMFEAVQGEGGVIPLEQAFVDEIFAIAAEKDILTIADEVQCGVGRTGKFLGVDNFGVKPDVVTLAKGLGGGLPIGVCLARGEAAKVLTPGTHGSTFGGNPVVCAGARVVLSKVLSSGFLEDVCRKGEKIRSFLLSLDFVTGVSGLGLMIGASLEGIAAAELCEKMLERGVLCLTAKDKLRLLPPLTVTDEELDAAFAEFEAVARELRG